MNFNFKLWQRAAAFGILCIVAILYLASTASDATHLAKATLRTPNNDAEAAYVHALTTIASHIPRKSRLPA